LRIALKSPLAAVKDWKNLAFAGSMLAVAAWVYSRVAMVNPAILGDEYLYSINSRKAAPWDPTPAGDFSNYLFNLVYSSTNLCGDAFYTCGKLLNLLFFVGFLTVIFIIAKRYMNYWIAFAFTILAGVSPLSVYTSMFLPESMYFFFLSLVLASVLKAADTFSWKDWALAGALIGVTSLVKPHAWLSAIAIGVFLVVVGLTNSKHRFMPLLQALGAITIGAVLARIIVGLIVAGPKALGFFGQYLNLSALFSPEDSASSQGSSSVTADRGGPWQGVVDLFLPQTQIHAFTVLALMGISTLVLFQVPFQLRRGQDPSKGNIFGLLALIWLMTMVIEIVMFTGWITGSGDDHTTRVLERYYDFLFVFVPLASLAVIFQRDFVPAPLLARISLGGLTLIAITSAFSGFFGNLTIQIADAPNLAGLVVNQDVFNSLALATFAGLLVATFFPKWISIAILATLPFSMAGTGYQIQDQYQGFRASKSVEDEAGQFLRAEFTSKQLDSTWIVASTRFQATNAAFWADSKKLTFDLFGEGSTVDDSLVPEGTEIILTTGGVNYAGELPLIAKFEGYAVYGIQK
jgi:phosphoglycerol transferase